MWFAKRAGVFVIIVGGFALLPDAPLTTDVLVIPDVIWNPLLGVLSLNRYFPIAALLAVATFDVTIKVGMFGLFLTSWAWSKVSP